MVLNPEISSKEYTINLENNPFSFEVVTNTGNDIRINAALILQYQLQKAGIKYQIVLRDVGITKLINDLNKAAGKDDIILSFHLNSGVVTATGTETLYWHTSTKGKKLAGLVQKNLVKVLGLADRGIKIRRKPLDTEDAKNQRG